MQQPDLLPRLLVMAPGTLGTGWHAGTSRRATHARSARSACTRQSACTYCKAPLRPHRIRSVTATVGRAHVRSQGVARRATEEPIVNEPTTGDATAPFDRRRGRRDVLALVLLHQRRCQCPSDPARAATPATVRYCSIHPPSTCHPLPAPTPGLPPIGTPGRSPTHPLELDRCGTPVFRCCHPCPLHTLNVLLREPHIKSHVPLR